MIYKFIYWLNILYSIFICLRKGVTINYNLKSMRSCNDVYFLLDVLLTEKNKSHKTFVFNNYKTEIMKMYFVRMCGLILLWKSFIISFCLQRTNNFCHFTLNHLVMIHITQFNKSGVPHVVGCHFYFRSIQLYICSKISYE